MLITNATYGTCTHTQNTCPHTHILFTWWHAIKGNGWIIGDFKNPNPFVAKSLKAGDG